MSNNATENSASRRIATVLDEGSFVEIGGAVTARNTDFNLQEKETPADGVNEDGSAGHRSDRLCRSSSSGSDRRAGGIWKPVL